MGFLNAMLFINKLHFFICYILAVVPIGYDPLLEHQAGETTNLLVNNCILCTLVLLSF